MMGAAVFGKCGGGGECAGLSGGTCAGPQTAGRGASAGRTKRGHPILGFHNTDARPPPTSCAPYPLISFWTFLSDRFLYPPNAPMGLPTWQQPSTPSLPFEREAFLPSSPAPSSPSGSPRSTFSFQPSRTPEPRHPPFPTKPAIPKRSLGKWAVALGVPVLVGLAVVVRSGTGMGGAGGGGGGGGLGSTGSGLGSLGKGLEGIKGWARPAAWSAMHVEELEEGSDAGGGFYSVIDELSGGAGETAEEDPDGEGDDRQSSEIDSAANDNLALDNDEPLIDLDAETIEVTALPRLGGPTDPEAKYIGFLPHSGFHNQRVALQNALVLGWLLNRTV